MEAQVELCGAEPFECFDNEVLLRPSWQPLRARAAEALRVFGWEGARLDPYGAAGPGVFRRMPPEVD